MKIFVSISSSSYLCIFSSELCAVLTNADVYYSLSTNSFVILLVATMMPWWWYAWCCTPTITVVFDSNTFGRVLSDMLYCFRCLRSFAGIVDSLLFFYVLPYIENLIWFELIWFLSDKYFRFCWKTCTTATHDASTRAWYRWRHVRYCQRL